jgi:hypothetical protein
MRNGACSTRATLREIELAVDEHLATLRPDS